ncbi:MAG: bifunctional DNA-formamidopyrimidine glycosylase/DNA-(apurinic or apyrimidinic site) lyase [Gemmatimonadaceae bacterium]|nr:bifunctional DNA-formamidopyrimidine glycosylase/DNA-(apurinic or apyrimidinic site) lyase [Gemmatimonadaceae bacterium]
MPELPETETIATDLRAVCIGAVVRDVSIQRPDVLRGPPASQWPARLVGARVARIHRRAKSIVIGTDRGDALVVTPRFTGILALDAAADDRYECLRLTWRDDGVLRYRDVRRLGTVALLDAEQAQAWDVTLGIEPLDPATDDARFRAALQGTRRAIKSVLMDQRRIAGIGNIYANEGCWHARVSPFRSAARLTSAQRTGLRDALQRILTDSITARGTTFRDYRDAHGARGAYAERLCVYGRADAPCPRCSTAIRVDHRLEGRATFWCASCQR